MHSQPLVPKHNAVPGWLGPKGPQSRLGWSCPGPGTMDACSLLICLIQCGFLPNKDHLAVSLLSVSAYSQKSKATLSGKGGAAVEVQRVLGRVEKEGSNPACVQPWSSGTPCVDMRAFSLPQAMNLFLCPKAMGFYPARSRLLIRLHPGRGAFYLILTKVPM